MVGKLLAALLVAMALWCVDRSLSDLPLWSAAKPRDFSRQVGNILRRNKDAELLILGQSTMGWLRPASFARLFQRQRRQVLDAHIGGCHPGCNWAFARQLRRRGRRFRQAVVGINLYQLCASVPRARLSKQLTILGTRDLPDQLRLYALSPEWGTAWSRLTGMLVSGSYRHSARAQRRASALWAPKRTNPVLWQEQRGVDAVQAAADPLPKPPKRKQPPPECDPLPEATRSKVAFVHALLKDLERISESTAVLLLPDVTASWKEAHHRQRWKRFFDLMQTVVEQHPRVELVDLVTSGPKTKNNYRPDGIHLNKRGRKKLTRVFSRWARTKQKKSSP